ncbi:hypothetical protein [[Clostridium] polysaccharolyticum]|uniref:Uncharacterized protein n=1 Tax=[Clostridium] polysaccharolyticum TaxID=29364 RepID=A0A1I0D1K0_9FIRM|nr:hypothetical protein [[Clostridium] polysaccharolyticum]SET25968.1 hypothetical protein SAMN04487772_11267 [[Clostridium] polysaccharolyticum]
MDKRAIQKFESMLKEFEAVSEVQAKKEVNGISMIAKSCYSVQADKEIKDLLIK